jgi:hypothetical protein
MYDFVYHSVRRSVRDSHWSRDYRDGTGIRVFYENPGFYKNAVGATLSLWSTSIVEGVVSKEGNGEQGPRRRWFNGSQVIAIFAIQSQDWYDFEALLGPVIPSSVLSVCAVQMNYLSTWCIAKLMLLLWFPSCYNSCLVSSGTPNIYCTFSRLQVYYHCQLNSNLTTPRNSGFFR